MYTLTQNKLFQILIVDDNTEISALLKRAIAREELNVFTAESGNEALAILNNRNADLILLDVQMPGMDGFETARKIRSRPDTRFVPVIFMTAIHKTRESELKAYACGAQDYLYKPFDIGVVRAKVDALLQFSRLKQEMEHEHEVNLEFQELIAHSENPICILEGPNFRFEYVNHWFEENLGYVQNEIKGTYFYGLFKPMMRKKFHEYNNNEKKTTTVYKIYGSFKCANRSLQKIEWTIIDKDEKWLCIGKPIGLPTLSATENQ